MLRLPFLPRPQGASAFNLSRRWGRYPSQPSIPRSRTSQTYSHFHLNLQHSFRRSLHLGRLPQSHNALACPSPRSLTRSLVIRRFNSSNAPEKPLSFSQRMRKLSREYGWSALGIYLFLSALDFPFCFAAVRLLGVERIGHYEQVVVEAAKRLISPIWPLEQGENRVQDHETGELATAGDFQGTTYDHGVVEAQKRNAEEGASIWTQLALAYAIHKSFIFIRVPLTAAITPKVVRVLRRWGWDIGKRKPKGG